MANLFRSNRSPRVKRNPFNLSHDVKLTTDFGRLTPVLCKEVVPGDIFRMKSEMLIRTSPLFAPLMHRVNAYLHIWYVPSRLLMDHFDTFITGGENGDGKIGERFSIVTSEVNKPFVYFKDLAEWYRRDNQALMNIFGNGSLFDYLGFPAQPLEKLQIGVSDTDQKIDLLPFFAYHLIYNENYRDENFEDKVDILKDVEGDVIDYLNDALSGGASTTLVNNILDSLFLCHQRNWEKDYFTSALPWPQRGSEQTLGEEGELGVQADATPTGYLSTLSSGKVNVQDVADHLDLGVQIPAVSINELRRSLAIQKFRERMARYGSRYTEFLRGVFGVAPKDSRLQRPEFLGGFKQQIQFGEVLQTSETTADSPQGAYAGTGFSLSGGKYIKRSFDEHGYIIGILSIMPKPAYMQGWPREFNRFDKLDYYIPDFDHLGEQDIRKRELNFNPNASSANGQLFGYTPRYSEYKFAPSRVCGEMRSTLDFWHLARRVADGQNLNASFLQVNQNEMDRVFNYVGEPPIEGSTTLKYPSTDDHFWIQVYHEIKALRPMSKFGTPLI